VLIDRRFNRDLPIQADYIGKSVDTLFHEKVKVSWVDVDGEDKVELYMKDSNE
jgi:pyrimidine operon attenuation protein/uracil phosphoribosyltransferase